MGAQGYFAHNSKDGRTPWDRADAQGLGANGENLAAGRSGAEEALQQLLDSDGCVYPEPALTPGLASGCMARLHMLVGTRHDDMPHHCRRGARRARACWWTTHYNVDACAFSGSAYSVPHATHQDAGDAAWMRARARAGTARTSATRPSRWERSDIAPLQGAGANHMLTALRPAISSALFRIAPRTYTHTSRRTHKCPSDPALAPVAAVCKRPSGLFGRRISISVLAFFWFSSFVMSWAGGV